MCGCTFVSMLSMQSKTKSGLPERISSSDDESYNSTFASIWHSGKINEKCFLRHSALGIPTSARVATACRFKDERETFLCKEEQALDNHINYDLRPWQRQISSIFSVLAISVRINNRCN